MKKKIIIKSPWRFIVFSLTAFITGALSYKFMIYLTRIEGIDGITGREALLPPLMILLFCLGWEGKNLISPE